MKNYWKFLLVAGVAITLAACSSNEETVNVDKPDMNGQTTFDLTGNGADPMYNDAPSAPRLTEYSTSNVQIFSLDDPAPNMNTPYRGSSTMGKPRLVGNSNVQIADIGQPRLTMPPTRSAAPAPQLRGPVTTIDPEPQAASNNDAVTRIFFEHGSAVLSTDDVQKLASVSRIADANTISVEGYASERVSAAQSEIERKQINLEVSMKRATAVAKNLIASGVPAQKIRTVAWGEEGANITVDGMNAEQSARRVDVIPVFNN